MKHEAVFNSKFLEAAVRTCKASRWERFKAKLFGEFVEAEDGGHRVTAYRYKGKLYMTGYTAPDRQETK